MGYKRVQAIWLYSYTFQEHADLLELKIHSLGRCVHVRNDWKKCSVSRLAVGYKTGVQLVKFH